MVLRNVLSTPAVAILLGLAFGALLAAPLFIGARLVSSDKIDAALYATMGSVMGGLLLSVGILFGFSWLAPDGFVWFGSALIAGFLVGMAGVGIVMIHKLVSSEKTGR